MEPRGIPLDTNQDEAVIPKSIEGIIGVLARRGCPDLTSSIDLAACSEHPHAGGGFSEVYQGTLYGGIRIAIKSLKVYGSQLERDSEGQRVLKRAAKELYHWSKLKHPNVLPLMGLAVFKGFPSMISEWMENGDLPSYLRLKPGTDRARLCMDVCAGLCYIHENGMVHGDLKGANVMISRYDTAMIADFGNARLQDLTLEFGTTTSRGLSYRWAAPELLLEENIPQVSMEADVYAYGMTVLEILTGKVPYEGVSERRVMWLVASGKKVPPRPDVEISDSLWELLNLCWDQVPSERPKMTSVSDRLEALFTSPDGPMISKALDVIESATSIKDIIGTLVRYGCRDLTLSIDLNHSDSSLSTGGWFNDVYPGVLHDGTHIAIKLPIGSESSRLHQDIERRKVLKRAAKEICHWSKLKHPNVLPLMGFAVCEESLLMISEWMVNERLISYLRQNPSEDRKKLIMDICEGLCYIHRNRMVHGNVRGANILVSSNGTAVVAGFGNAYWGDSTLKFASTGNHANSTRWAAPELLEDGGPRGSMEADVYAYGMTILEALTGKLPYHWADESRVPDLVLVEKMVPTRPGTGISDGLWEVLNSCWAWDPSQRPNITTVADRLEALSLSHPPSPSPTSPPTSTFAWLWPWGR